VNAALTRFRIMAYVTGVGLLVLCGAVVLKYGFDMQHATSLIGFLHGIFYMAYLVTAFDLAFRARWKIGTAILMLIAGTIPVCSFIAERKAVHWARQAMPAAAH